MKLLFFSAMAFIFLACNSGSDKSKTPSKDSIGIDTVTTKETPSPAVDSLFACSMHPEVTGKKGDRCPKCNMELTVPVKHQ